MREQVEMLKLTFEWHDGKNKENIRKHDVSFDEARTVFNDPFAMTIYDPDHSVDEDRFIDIGISCKGRLLVVSYVERADYIRIISGRKATELEISTYENK